MNKQHNTFNIVIHADAYNTKALTFHIVGFDSQSNTNICRTIEEMFDELISNNTFSEPTCDYISIIINEAWKRHIHLEYNYPTYGTFVLN